MQVFLLLPLISIILFVIIIVVFIFSVYSSDRFKNPEEYKDTGSAGERIIFTTLRDKIHVPEKQILRNVFR